MMKPFAFVLLLALTLSASAKDIADLIDRPNRPTMLETLRYLDDIQEESGVPVAGSLASFLDTRIDIQKWLQILLASAPQLIATTEVLHPNAVWVFLGRDTLAISDVFEAYYHSIGQSNRVIRLGVSKASFNNVSTDDLRGYLNEFLKDRGFSWLQAKKTPFVLMDSVSSGYGRQGRSILASMYKNGIDEGESIFTMLESLNILGLKVSTFGNQHEVFDVRDAQFQQLREKWRFLFVNNETHPDFLFEEKTLLTYEAANHANEAGYTHYIGAWHDSYGAFNRDSGRVSTALGKEYPVVMKKSILWTQKRIWEEVRKPQFRHRVEAAKKNASAVIRKSNHRISDEDLNRLNSILEKALQNKDRHDLEEKIAAASTFAQKPETFTYFTRLIYTLLADTPLTAEILYAVHKDFMSPSYFRKFVKALENISKNATFKVEKNTALSELIEIIEILNDKSCESALRAS